MQKVALQVNTWEQVAVLKSELGRREDGRNNGRRDGCEFVD